MKFILSIFKILQEVINGSGRAEDVQNITGRKDASKVETFMCAAIHNDDVDEAASMMGGATAAAVKAQVLGEMATAIENRDWEAWYDLLSMTCSIKDAEVKAETLNKLLVMPGHELHQEVTMEIQELRSASSVPYIQAVLESGFDFLQYTYSEDEAIAKWFSHALARIGTPEAIELIEKHALSSKIGIAKEMRYRLERLKN